MENNEQKQREQFTSDLNQFAVKYSLMRVKTETPYFKRDYQLQADGSLKLTSEKAVVIALGKTTVVSLGGNHQYKTYEEAEEAVRLYWSKYFKLQREKRSDKAKLSEARRQKRYREKRKQQNIELKRQQ